jgi:hypothetical protein
MKRTNRHKILNTDICDFLDNLNDSLSERAEYCILDLLDPKQAVNDRCVRYPGNCHACISEWLNEEEK